MRASFFNRSLGMKTIGWIVWFCISIGVRAQSPPISINHMPSIAEVEKDPALLARSLTAGLVGEREKARAIFDWVTTHIAYNTAVFSRKGTPQLMADPMDTAAEWKSGEEMTARKVLLRKTAVCEGYARLFKVLCDYAGLRSEVIMGYAKCYVDRQTKFRTNHSWNAVRIDSSWYLLDLTWASGYVNFANEFVPHRDESYYLADPAQFIYDHYPEDLRWTLLKDPPARKEFASAPFRYKSFIKYTIASISPSSGIIEASPGDTVHIILEIKDPKRDQSISADPFFDSTLLSALPSSVILHPHLWGNKAIYEYIVPEGAPDWLHLLYNEDMILRYRLHLKKRS